MNKLLFSLLFLALAFTAAAQDRVYRKDGKVLRGKVLEVGSSEIKFQYENETIFYYIDVALVEKIVFESGRKETFYDDGLEPGYYAKQRRNALKFAFFSLSRDHLTLSYERAVKPGFSFEVDMNVIGVGFSNTGENAAGFGLAGGAKFFTSKRRNSYHMLKGFYLSPKVYVNYYSRDYMTYNPNVMQETKERKESTTGALMLNLGYQFVLNNRFLLDFYAGFGYGFTSFNPYDVNGESYYYYDYYTNYNFQYGYSLILDGPPFAGTAGFRVGVLLD